MLLLEGQKNGSKARIGVTVGKNKLLKNIILRSICESKSFTVRLSGHLPDSRTSVDEDLKSIYQPITEVCAVSELCRITCDEVPGVNIFGSRHTYRPFLFFRESMIFMDWHFYDCYLC